MIVKNSDLNIDEILEKIELNDRIEISGVGGR